MQVTHLGNRETTEMVTGKKFDCDYSHDRMTGGIGQQERGLSQEAVAVAETGGDAGLDYTVCQ